MTSLKERIQQDVITAMKAGDKPRVAATRLITAALKQVEVDQRIVLSDPEIESILSKLAKQRRESIEQYKAGGRQDLVDQEQYELNLILSYLPQALSDAEVDSLIQQTIAETGASNQKDMGKLMAALKPKLQNRADLTVVSSKVKQLLS